MSKAPTKESRFFGTRFFPLPVLSDVYDDKTNYGENVSLTFQLLTCVCNTVHHTIHELYSMT